MVNDTSHPTHHLSIYHNLSFNPGKILLQCLFHRSRVLVHTTHITKMSRIRTKFCAPLRCLSLCIIISLDALVPPATAPPFYHCTLATTAASLYHCCSSTTAGFRPPWACFAPLGLVSSPLGLFRPPWACFAPLGLDCLRPMADYHPTQLTPPQLTFWSAPPLMPPYTINYTSRLSVSQPTTAIPTGVASFVLADRKERERIRE